MAKAGSRERSGNPGEDLHVGITTGYTDDDAGRLVSVDNGAAGRFDYTYNAVNNGSEMSRNKGRESRAEMHCATNIAHDANGNLKGREWLAKIGLYDYRHRVYSPELGRFLQADPIRFAAGDRNLYRYVGNHSARARDPEGMLTDCQKDQLSRGLNSAAAAAAVVAAALGSVAPWTGPYIPGVGTAAGLAGLLSGLAWGGSGYFSN